MSPPQNDTTRPREAVGPHSAGGSGESDEEFLDRQFRSCVQALESAGALVPGEFDKLVRTPARLDTERARRAEHHRDIALRALRAVQQGGMQEEDFNLWSGRRKEQGEPVKHRFERAYTALSSPMLSCKRGTLTGIVRAYQRLLDELLETLKERGTDATSADELLAAERFACECGLLEFEMYSGSPVNGWPTFPRSTGRFRGASNIRALFELRQAELPLPTDLADQIVAEMAGQPPKVPPIPTASLDRSPDTMTSIRRLFAKITQGLQHRDGV